MNNVLGIIRQIQKRIGNYNWNKLSYETKYILIGDEIKVIKQEMIRIYGSSSNYYRHWLKQQGMRKIDYVDWCAQQNGFKNQKEYLDQKYKEKGFKGLYDYRIFKRLRKKYHKSISDFEVRKIQLDREKEKELQHFIIIRRSMRLNSKSCKVRKNGVLVKSARLLKHTKPIRMTSEKEVIGVKPSIHPTIDVCGKQTGGVLI